MIKIVGSLIVIGTATLTGFFYAGLLSKRVSQLREIQYALSALETDITYTETPLFMALKNASKKCSFPIGPLLLHMSSSLELRKVSSVLDAFKEALLAYKNEVHIGKEELEVVSSFMSTLGSSDIEGQKKNFNLTVKRLELLEGKAEETKGKNEKLYKYLGMSSGILVVILLF